MEIVGKHNMRLKLPKGRMFHAKYWIVPYNPVGPFSPTGHWSLMILVRPKYLYQKETSSEEKKPIIYYIDSIGEAQGPDFFHKATMDTLHKFLHNCHKRKFNNVSIDDNNPFDEIEKVALLVSIKKMGMIVDYSQQFM